MVVLSRKIIDVAIIALIGGLIFCYSIYYAPFSKLHIILPSLNLPVFVGEIVLFICTILAVIRYVITPRVRSPWHLLLLVYIIFILIKAFGGYSKWGHLAMRNAALFYYPLFAVIVYHSFPSSFYTDRFMGYIYPVLIAAGIYLIGVPVVRDFFRFTYFILLILLTMRLKVKVLKYTIFIVLLLLIPFKLTVTASKSSIVAMLVSFLFFTALFIFYFIKINFKVKAFYFIIVSVLVGIFVLQTGDKVILRLLFSLKQFTSDCKKIAKRVDSYGKFKFEKVPVKLYLDSAQELKEQEITIEALTRQGGKVKIVMRLPADNKLPVLEPPQQIKAVTQEGKEIKISIRPPEEDKSVSLEPLHPIEAVTHQEQESESAAQSSAQIPVVLEQPLMIEALTKGGKKIKIVTQYPFENNPSGLESNQQIEAVTKEGEEVRIVMQSPLKNDLSAVESSRLPSAVSRQEKEMAQQEVFGTAYSNVRWRLFVWIDMLREWWHGGIVQRILGVDFGKPFRSRTVEIMKWSDGKWVGWVEPHNSYIHILYRTGIIGLLFIVLMLTIFIKITMAFIKNRNIRGFLLITILLYWCVISSINVVLELPYLAIPFWSLFGITLKYSHSILK